MKNRSIILAFLCAIAAIAALPVAASAQTQTASFVLTWTDNSSGAAQEDGFNVERKLGTTGSYARIGGTATDVATFTDTITNAGSQVTYCYRVNAFNAAGISAYSNESCAATPLIVIAPNPPTGLVVKP